MDSLALPRQGQRVLVEPSSRPHWGHLTKRKIVRPEPYEWPLVAHNGPFRHVILLCPVEVCLNWIESGYIPACPAETYDSSGRYVVQFRRPCYSVRDWYGGLMERAITRNYSRR